MTRAASARRGSRAGRAGAITDPKGRGILDAVLERRGRLDRISWGLGFLGLVGYTLAVVTYALPIGEASMILALVGLLLAPARIRMPGFLAVFGAFLLWATLGYSGTLYPDAVGKELVGGAKLWLIAFVAVNVLRTPSQLRGYLVFFLACFAMYPARGAIFNFLGGYTVFGRALWNHIFENPNDLAALTFLPLSIALGLLVTERKGLFRWGAIASLVVLPTLILMTQSRGAFIALVIVALFALLRQRKKARAAVVAAALVVVAVAVVPSGAWERFSGISRLTSTATIAEADEEGSAEERFAIWRTAALIVKEHKISGVGLGAYPYAHERYAVLVPGSPVARKDAHSTYLRVAATTGIPGLILFLGMLAATLIRVERVRGTVRRTAPRHSMQLYYLELGLVAYLLAGVFGSFDLLAFLYLHMAVIWAASEVALRSHEKLRRGLRRASGRAGPWDAPAPDPMATAEGQPVGPVPSTPVPEGSGG